jgi:hypothetical protein
MYKYKDTLKEKNQNLDQEWLKNQNINGYYNFLGVHYFHECVHRWGKHSPPIPIK